MKFYVMIFVMLLFIVSCSNENKSEEPVINENQSETLKVCPDELIDNQMPGNADGNGTVREYYIFDGKRRELDEFDQIWIGENCDIKKQVVY